MTFVHPTSTAERSGLVSQLCTVCVSRCWMAAPSSRVRPCARKQREASSTKAPQQAVKTSCEYRNREDVLGQPLLDGGTEFAGTSVRQETTGGQLDKGTATGCEHQL